MISRKIGLVWSTMYCGNSKNNSETQILREIDFRQNSPKYKIIRILRGPTRTADSAYYSNLGKYADLSNFDFTEFFRKIDFTKHYSSDETESFMCKS